MPKLEILNNEKHRDVKIITDRGSAFGENANVIPALVNEMGALVLDFPVCLLKDPENGNFGLHIFLGFEPDENLFLDGKSWKSSHIPAHVRRQPFRVGFSQDEEGKTRSALITLDVESKRVNSQLGERIFDEDGNRTPFLMGMEQLLNDVLRGEEASQAFVQLLVDNDLVEPVQLKAEFEEGQSKTFDGLYTVNDSKFADLSTKKLNEFNKNGVLKVCHQMTTSLGHIRKMIEWKKNKVSG